MTSFFEKLKKGMSVEGSVEKELIKKPKKPITKRELKLEKKPVENKTEEPALKETKTEIRKLSIQKEEIKKPSFAKVPENKEKWFEAEGQLAIDVYQTNGELVIQSAIAGVKPENLDISIEKDTVLIKGVREKPIEENERNYFYQECYWGPFSRQLFLSVEVDPSRAEATLKEGILTIRMPKIEREKKRKIVIKE